MIRMYIICEGQTEETFINVVLQERYSHLGIYLYPLLLGKPGHKGGNVKYQRLLTDVEKLLKGNPKAYCSTLFDYYGLPSDFPGKLEAQKQVSSAKKASCVQQMLTKQLQKVLSEEHMRRFIPYVQMHEFEGLLFSNPSGLAQAIEMPNLATSFNKIRNGFNSPEEINDSPMTSPSKRIKTLFREYDKPLHGSLAVQAIGLDVIRAECPLFNGWLSQIEALLNK